MGYEDSVDLNTVISDVKLKRIPPGNFRLVDQESKRLEILSKAAKEGKQPERMDSGMKI